MRNSIFNKKRNKQTKTKTKDFFTKCPGQSVQLFSLHCAVYYHIYNQFYDFEVAYGDGSFYQ